MEDTYCKIAEFHKKGIEHCFVDNYFGDRICKYCSYAPEGHKPIEDIMVQLTQECQTCGHQISDHIIDHCMLCECKEPIFSISINKKD